MTPVGHVTHGPEETFAEAEGQDRDLAASGAGPVEGLVDSSGVAATGFCLAIEFLLAMLQLFVYSNQQG